MAGNSDLKAEELKAIVEGIRDRVRARYPQGSAGALNIALPDLTPILRARDAAEAKVAAIGKVNPRPGGPVNGLIQFVKRQVARALDWHVREQVEFNRASMECIEALLTALNESNRALNALALEIGKVPSAELLDMRGHWIEWRQEWERKLAANEALFLRNTADLSAAFQHRAAMMDAGYRDLIRSQHAEFTASLERAAMEMQKALWADKENVRAEYERVIHNEIRVLRQRGAAAFAPAPNAELSGAPPFDYLSFADRFRGSEEYVRQGQQVYRPYFEGRKRVLDIGCGRGEFLELMREIGSEARGVELSAELVSICRSKGLDAEQADAFKYLDGVDHASLDGIFCSQVIEHLPPERIPELVRLSAEALERGGVIAFETPNPECLAIFATHFYLDPTHTRPIPPGLMVFYLEEAGFGRIEVRRLSPAIDSMPTLRGLPEDFREAFFGALDYAVIARKL